ncbi:hypothetical protein L1049_001882 [Liquidambar formosana]|uniref:BPL/LPL catalytic domain-containing protein n=1 Tax=Liquidambar formosana TaxID=63359 RepID=A0AAP0NG62_LIQFO
MTIHQARIAGLPLMNLIRFKGTPIFQQLQLEERLLRTSSDNWCIINDGTNAPAIVMGMSGRFTGGGTVIVDHGTVFITFICNKDAVPDVQPYPRSIMSWSSLLYSEVFRGIDNFQLRENDYVFGNCKFGGNAQSITKKRWIHHTSFLWDYEDMNMAYLKLPEQAPEYRLARGHMEFVCRMKDYLPNFVFIENTVKAIETHFSVNPVNLESIVAPCDKEFVHSTRLLAKEELEEAYACPAKSQSHQLSS